MASTSPEEKADLPGRKESDRNNNHNSSNSSSSSSKSSSCNKSNNSNSNNVNPSSTYTTMLAFVIHLLKSDGTMTFVSSGSLLILAGSDTSRARPSSIPFPVVDIVALPLRQVLHRCYYLVVCRLFYPPPPPIMSHLT